MPIEVRWLIKNQVILTHLIGQVSAQEIADYIDKSFVMRDKANEANGQYGALIHTVTDATRVESQKTDLGTLSRTMKSLRRQRVGWSLYVTSNRFERFASTLLHQFAGVRFQSFDTMQEALTFLRISDDSLCSTLTDRLDLSPWDFNELL